MLLRPAVGMQQIVAVPYVVALGACDAIEGARIEWPHGVVGALQDAAVLVPKTHAGYDEGMFVEVDLGELEENPGVCAAVEQRVSSWADSLAGKPRMAPLAPVLSEYCDRLADFGGNVRVEYPNGKPYATGIFAGVDVWGRATVRRGDGLELEFPPEQYRIVPL